MKILAIETSCDETAISIIEAQKIGSETKFKILGNEISSQIDIHKEFGGVFPMMAKREHGKNIVHVTEKVLKEAKLYKKTKNEHKIKVLDKIDKILEKEDNLRQIFIENILKIKKPDIDAIAVTTGPGLEPALWVGISFAKALSVLWDLPIIPVNHMEGHIFSIFPKKGKTFTISSNKKIFPMLSLLVSGGHTELVLIKDWHKYKKIGQTRDDAVGEAFDKVARMLGLPYPGGPEISKLAEKERLEMKREYIVPGSLAQGDGPSRAKSQQRFMCADGNNISSEILPITFPRPMMYTKNYDFSFSGLKTAVLYKIRDLGDINDNLKRKIAKEFEDAVVEVLVHKTLKAIKEYKIKTVIVGGGVSANSYLQEQLKDKAKKEKLEVKIFFPSKSLTGDNALMIAIAGYYQYKNKKIVKNLNSIKAKGNISL